MVVPAFERAVTSRGERLMSLPIREVDIGVERELLDAEPGVALVQTQQIAAAVNSVAAGQDFLLDNISNTLDVARNDATTAKQMFVFLGAPGAMLAAYAGIVLGSTQRRERATLRMHGASRSHLLRMLAIRVSCIVAAGAAVAVALGYISAALVIGHDTLTRASAASLAISAVLGAIVGLLATGGALYTTGYRSIESEINEDRARLWTRTPPWKRYQLDIAGLVAVGLATIAVATTSGFEGLPGSVYQGRAVNIPLYLLLPLGAQLAGFLKVKVGDKLEVLLARNTPQQVLIEMDVIGLFERLPGFPDGAQALMNIGRYEEMAPSARPAFFLAQTAESSDAALAETIAAFAQGPGSDGTLQVDTRLTALAKDQSSLAALNIGGLIRLVSAFALAMGTGTIAIFVFALMLQRRREYITLRALGMQPAAIRSLIAAGAGTAALAGCAVGVPVGLLMAYYLVNVLRPLFVLNPPYLIPFASLVVVTAAMVAATVVTSLAASPLVNRMRATELLRDE